MSQVRRTLWEFLTGKEIDYYMDQRIEGVPPIQTNSGSVIHPKDLSFFAVGDRLARICLSGPIDGNYRHGTSVVYYDNWEDMPEAVAVALVEHFADAGMPQSR